MKLYHRTSYWGSLINGRRSNAYMFPVIYAQAVLNDDFACFGCCRHHGPRCVELDETHFMSNDRGLWDLYHTRTGLNDDRGQFGEYGHYYHDFALLPQSTTTAQNIQPGWSHIGTIRPCMARIDLEPLIRPFLLTNESFHPYAHQHVHIAIQMERVIVDATRRELSAPIIQKKKNRTRNQNLEQGALKASSAA